MLENQPELQAYFEEFSSQAESNIDSLLNVDTIQKVQSIINSLSVQLFGVLGVVKNIFLGLLISAYLLGSRKLFGAQAGLILHLSLIHIYILSCLYVQKKGAAYEVYKDAWNRK